MKQKLMLCSGVQPCSRKNPYLLRLLHRSKLKGMRLKKASKPLDSCGKTFATLWKQFKVCTKSS